MTVKINADTSDGLKFVSDTSGTVDIQSNGTTKLSVGSTIDCQGNELVLDADGNTSLREVADNKINFKVGGTDKMQFDDNGRLLFEHLQSANIGGAECKLQIQGTSTETSSISLKSNANSSAAPTLRFGKSRGTSVNSETVVQNNDELGVIVFAGADGSDTQSQGAVIIAAVDGTPGSNDLPTRLVFQTTADGASGTTERMRIDKSGQIMMGSTSQDLGERLHIAHTGGGVVCVMRTVNSGGTVQIGFKNANGFVGEIVTSGSGTSYATSSDYRLKENVSYTFDATSRLKQLKPARFNFKADADTTLDGFLAHEVSSIVPEAVIGEKDATEKYTDEDGKEQTRDKHQSIDQSKLVPLLVKTIQELEARITALES
jgi:hypothetical protein